MHANSRCSFTLILCRQRSVTAYGSKTRRSLGRYLHRDLTILFSYWVYEKEDGLAFRNTWMIVSKMKRYDKSSVKNTNLSEMMRNAWAQHNTSMLSKLCRRAQLSRRVHGHEIKLIDGRWCWWQDWKIPCEQFQLSAINNADPCTHGFTDQYWQTKWTLSMIHTYLYIFRPTPTKWMGKKQMEDLSIIRSLPPPLRCCKLAFQAAMYYPASRIASYLKIF